MRDWLESEAWDGCYFSPVRLGPKHVLYRTTFAGPLVGLLINGHSERAPWRAEEFFNLLRPLAGRSPCSWIYITDPDNALSVFEWEQSYDPNYFGIHRLWVFEISPADEGGAAYLVLAFHDRKGVIVFEFDPGQSFEIAFYGSDERLAEIRDHLDLK